MIGEDDSTDLKEKDLTANVAAGGKRDGNDDSSAATPPRASTTHLPSTTTTPPRIIDSALGEVLPGLFVGTLASVRRASDLPSFSSSSTPSLLLPSATLTQDQEVPSTPTIAVTVVTILSSDMLIRLANDCVYQQRQRQQGGGEGPCTALPPVQLRHVVIRLDDKPNADLLGALPAALDAIDGALNSSFPGCCLVHCAKGSSRSVAVCVAYLMVRRGMSFATALDTARRARPGASPNVGFIASLLSLERRRKKDVAGQVRTTELERSVEEEERGC